MNKLKGVIAVIGLIVKYSAIVMAVIKGIQVVHDELEKLDFSDDPKLKTKLEVKDE